MNKLCSLPDIFVAGILALSQLLISPANANELCTEGSICYFSTLDRVGLSLYSPLLDPVVPKDQRKVSLAQYNGQYVIEVLGNGLNEGQCSKPTASPGWGYCRENRLLISMGEIGQYGYLPLEVVSEGKRLIALVQLSSGKSQSSLPGFVQNNTEEPSAIVHFTKPAIIDHDQILRIVIEIARDTVKKNQALRRAALEAGRMAEAVGETGEHSTKYNSNGSMQGTPRDVVEQK